ncbi:MAG TPA: S9 family peptidase [Candidatus Marinimicrobia bacterium]|nr:S9 family peptidase [Candidatus Neomarinimicrobiota bacterium]
MSKKIRLIIYLGWFAIIHGEMTPWWDVQYRLDIDYPSLGDHRWLPDHEILIVRGRGVNRRSFYRVDPAIGDTVLYLDSTAFSYNGEYVPVVNWKFSTNGKLMLVQSTSERIWRHSRLGSFYILYIEQEKLVPVSKKNQQLRNVKFSPNSQWVAYVRTDNNLYAYNLDRRKEKKLTRTGSETILNGHFGWVYEEELSGYDAYRWSPDSKFIAYWEEDQSPVPEYTLIDELPLYPETQKIRYPKAGEANPQMRIAVINVQGGGRKFFDIDSEEDVYYPWMEWQNTERLWILKLERRQKSWQMLYANVVTGRTHPGIKESDPDGWVELHDGNQILLNGRFLHISERDGYQHIYLEPPGGRFAIPVTSGRWEVKDIVHVDEINDIVYFTANRKSIMDNHLYSIRLDGTELKLLTPEPGVHRIKMHPNGKVFIDTYSSIEHPRTIVYRRTNGELIRTLGETDSEQIDSLDISIPKIVRFPAADNETILNGIITFPVNYEAGKSYPVIVYGYGMPGTQIVWNRWQGGLQQFLAKDGYMIFSMDSRGMAGRGRDFKNLSYGDMANYLSDDHAAGVKWLIDQGYANPDKIGAWGWSGGGYFTCLMLTKNAHLFSTGVSVAPVTDFRFYDTAYTERYMGLPQENKAGYDSTSTITYVDRLKGKILLMHGTKDDNVHFQNTTKFVEACIRADKAVDVMYYPSRNHGIYGHGASKHVYKKLFEYFRLHLKIG